MRSLVALASITALAVACERQPSTAPLDEVSLAANLSAEAVAAMSSTDGGPASLLRRMVQGVRESGNARAIAVLDAGNDLQAIVLVFPGAAPRISNMVQTGLTRVGERLGSRDAPRIRAALNDIAGLLLQSAAAQDAGRLAGALDRALTAHARLARLQDFLR